tara:strand:+ start:586 stop:852 length:267 start_codon:yes stop_codon:yes gene_type:complete
MVSKVKVPFRFNSKGYDQSGQEYIELVDGGSDGYDDGKDFHGEWWKKIPDSKDYGTTGYTVKYSHQICAACESDLVNGKCPICAGDEE